MSNLDFYAIGEAIDHKGQTETRAIQIDQEYFNNSEYTTFFFRGKIFHITEKGNLQNESYPSNMGEKSWRQEGADERKNPIIKTQRSTENLDQKTILFTEECFSTALSRMRKVGLIEHTAPRSETISHPDFKQFFYFEFSNNFEDIKQEYLGSNSNNFLELIIEKLNKKN